MATNMMGNMPPAQGNPMPTAPTAPAAPDDASGGGYTIEIEVAGDGTITVSSESAGAEDAETAGGDESADEANSVPVGSIKEACAMAEQIFQNNGKMPSGPDDAMGAARAGYAKKASRQPPSAPNAAGLFGE